MPEKKQVFVVYVVSKALSWLRASGMFQAFKEIFFWCVYLLSLSRLIRFYTHTQPLYCMWTHSIQLLECYLPSPHPLFCTLHIFPLLYPPLSLSVCLSGLVQRCVIIQRDENGFGLTVSGDNPVFVQLVKEGKKDTIPVVHRPCFALHNIHMQNSFTSDLNTH